MPPRANRVDIWSKGEVVQHLQELIETGQVKSCRHLVVQQGHADAYYPRCKKDWASREPADNVALDVTAYHGPSSYFWPKCPEGCPKFDESLMFVDTASGEKLGNPLLGAPEDKPAVKKKKRKELEMPLVVTLPWLAKHVSARQWFGAVLTALAILVTIFVFGLKASQWSFVQEMFEFLPSNAVTESESTKPETP